MDGATVTGFTTTGETVIGAIEAGRTVGVDVVAVIGVVVAAEFDPLGT